MTIPDNKRERNENEMDEFYYIIMTFNIDNEYKEKIFVLVSHVISELKTHIQEFFLKDFGSRQEIINKVFLGIRTQFYKELLVILNEAGVDESSKAEMFRVLQGGFLKFELQLMSVIRESQKQELEKVLDRIYKEWINKTGLDRHSCN